MATETCSGCGVARYCGAFCQHKDWDDHARLCRGEGNSSGSPDSNSNNTGENNNAKVNNTRPPATTTATTTESSEA